MFAHFNRCNLQLNGLELSAIKKAAPDVPPAIRRGKQHDHHPHSDTWYSNASTSQHASGSLTIPKRIFSPLQSINVVNHRYLHFLKWLNTLSAVTANSHCRSAIHRCVVEQERERERESEWNWGCCLHTVIDYSIAEPIHSVGGQPSSGCCVT